MVYLGMDNLDGGVIFLIGREYLYVNESICQIYTGHILSQKPPMK